ncbi:MAG: hypothetical protein ACE5EM_10280 [Sphingomonadales bacterium]
MPRSANAQRAVDMFEALQGQYNWTAATAWQGIARLLLSCEVWRQGWQPFHDTVVYREANDFREGPRGPNAVMQRAQALTVYLAAQLGVPRSDLCQEIASYWRHPDIANFQPHNLAGHAFRSLTVHILERFGDSGIAYAEEISPYQEFPGQHFATRSRDPKIDIAARRGGVTVALISSRWRYRHDRVDVVEEAMAYAPAARRHNPSSRLYAVVGEFAPNRLDKVLSNCPPAQPHGALTAAVHFAPQLITSGLDENGRLAHLKSLEWLIGETFRW